MTPRSIVRLLVVIAVSLFGGLDGWMTITSYLTAGSSGDPTPVAGIGETVLLDIEGSSYSVPSLIVNVGDTVTWTNRDPVAHTVSFADEALDDSGLLQQGDGFSATFDTPGTYRYLCDPHPFMTGMVVVR